MFFNLVHQAEALDIQYGNVRGYSGLNVLVQYYGIGKKNNYICNISNLKCTSTKKTTLGKTDVAIIKDSIRTELENKKAENITPSKSGNWLAYFIGASEPSNTRTYAVRNLKTNIEYTISTGVSYWDLVSDLSNVFEFSPDEKTLIYMDDKDNYMSLYKVNLNSLKSTALENAKIKTSAYNIGMFTFSDSQNIYYVGNSKINPHVWSLYNFNLITNKEKLIETDVSYLDKITKVGSYLIFNHLQEKGYGPEIYNTKTKKLSSFKVPNINSKKVIRNEKYIKIGNMGAVIMTPLSYSPKKAYPVLIWLHGGPLRQTSLGYHPYHSYGIYDGMLKLLQKNNVIVLKLDYRGSLGYGRDYSESIKGSVGSGDIDDVMQSIEYLKKQYQISDVYLAGNSYGGYMSLKAVVDHPTAFKGVFSINGVTDWESLLVKMKTSIFNTQFNGLPNNENKNLYEKASIINKIPNLGNQRIEIIQGEADGTIAPWQASLLYGKLKDAGKNANLVTYPKEDHVFAQKKNIGDVCLRLFNLMGIKNNKECLK